MCGKIENFENNNKKQKNYKLEHEEIKLICYDFDGVMTDNKVYIDQDGCEMVQVNRADGLGVAEIKNLV